VNKVLITGAAGFIGSHLVEQCLALGLQVTGFVRYNSTGNYPSLQAVVDHPGFRLHRGDIRDLDSVKAAAHGCDTILHLAALIGIPYSYESPIAYIRTNIEGTYNILEAARAHDCRNVVVTSTSETYGTAQFVPITEEHPANAQSPYAATKVAADQLALSYFRSFELPVKIIRPFNTYGPRQSARAIIPTVISQLLAGHTSIRLGSTAPTRDLTFVADTVAGFIAVAGSERCQGEVVNLGTQSEITIGDLAHRIAGRLGVALTIETDTGRLRPAASEVERLLSDNSKVRRLADWKPIVDLDDGLDRTIAWMRSNQQLYSPNRYQT
jgi:dTDP-glucose 4,6-dehydratase